MRVMVEKLRRLGAWLGCLLLASLVVGCGQSGAELADVSGTVTMDGQPLPNVLLEFQPEEGSPSYGTTDASGNYYLKYTKDRDGARLGRHVVRIKPAEVVNEEGERVRNSITIPPRYFRKSELSAVVESGSNSFNFDLTSSAN